MSHRTIINNLPRLTAVRLRGIQVALVFVASLAVTIPAFAFTYQTGNGRLSLDADGDGVIHNTDNCPLVSNANQADLDVDSIGDACDTDMDGDGLLNTTEYTLGTDPADNDTDNDGLNDGAEVNQYGTVPTDPDSDNDGLNDGAEIAQGSNPLDPQSPAVADGDLNMDGALNAADLIIAHRAAIGEIALTPAQLAHGDVAPKINGVSAPDGQFNVGDVVVITRMVFQIQ